MHVGGSLVLPTGELVLVVVVCVVFAAFFSGTETGFLTVSRLRLRRMAGGGQRGVAALLRLLTHLEDAILTCLVGTNLFTILASSLVTAALVARFGHQGGWLAVAITATVMVIFGEIIPKILYREYPERLTIASVPGLRAFMVVVAPVRWLLGGYTRLLQRITGGDGRVGDALDRTGLVALLVGQGAPGTQDRRFQIALERFLHLSGTTIAEMARPLDQIVSVPAGISLGDALNVAQRSGFSRLPLRGDASAELNGYLLVRDLLFQAEEPGQDLAEPVPEALVRTILLVDGNLSPYELFEELHHQQHQLAIVVDRAGRSRGLLTLEDLIEKVTGSISDEFDPQAAAVRQDGKEAP